MLLLQLLILAALWILLKVPLLALAPVLTIPVAADAALDVTDGPTWPLRVVLRVVLLVVVHY